MMKKIAGKILEITWLIVAALALFAGLHKTYFHGFNHSYQFFIIFLLSLLMYYNRRNHRISK
ncbi:MAG: hypothetical protein H6538_05295 [Bacteroidales bacterium]|nr:hypothetical protein [Bacteroidales bacterium]MCB9012981.1 hypothetical protein [Bacteroidales bacterium]